MIDREHDLPIAPAGRSSEHQPWQYLLPAAAGADADLAIMRCLDRLHMDYPLAGSRMLRGLLAAENTGSAGGM
jgi:putative transposase